MFITSREKAIIELIIKTSGRHTALSIATFLNVSVRTIQRDLKSIEKILKDFDLQLIRNPNDGLVIEGKNEKIFKLIQHLMGIHPVDLPPQERKLQLLLALLQKEESYKIQGLAFQLGVSITTLTAYLDELADWLANFHVKLTRKRGVGVEITGKELDKRKALAGFFLLYFNEELIESLFLLEKGNCSNEKVLYFFSPSYLHQIDKAVNASINTGMARLADSDYIGFIVHLCITMQRAEEGFFLEEENSSRSDVRDEYQLVADICGALKENFSIPFSHEDIHYLAVILKGSKLQAADAVPYDSVVLGQRIKKLIQYVSTQLHVDLTKDFSLFQGLLAHMEPSLFRIKQQMGLFNPLTEEIKRKYPVLFMAIKNGVEKEFEEFGFFPDDEIAFIVLHFGSALVMREEDLPIHALVVCPTGIGTSKMLASRIKKEIVEIDSVEVKSIKEMQEGNYDRYDVIISTVRLPFIDMDYILVTPLLSEEDITNIRDFLRKNIEALTQNKHYIKSTQKEPSAPKTAKRPITEVLQELNDTQQSMASLLTNFRVYRLHHLQSHEQTLSEMVRQAEEDKLLTNGQDVMETLKERERKGGLGIPGTSMGLFHCRSEHVKQLVFQISHLENPCLVKGMDGKNMYMKSLLLMLAPEELSAREQEIVSLVSTSLIENNEAIMIFSSSNEEMILERLESIFLEYLHTNLIKE
ncbi:BglG family transcription antiterminator [Heyndrickxia acidicola]|uniref:BglG family transcription antiterminator n=1 Tax=Heyndrickxia acidicola TaxID=209389 RepID=A0ABU6MKX8_9BACI|nr:BglG family transcription antiterminator [Heyndrickxia acidicola]MED1204621.1 BglG family transcription antiterminator [Heyndrickxia acidicola]